MDFSTRSYQTEILDEDNIPFEEIRLNMEELDTINTHLGGHAITLAGLKKIISGKRLNEPLTVAEIGCGGGDNLLAIHRSMRKTGIPFHFIGIDIKRECIDYAREKFSSQKDSSSISVELIVSDYKALHWSANKPDIIFSSLFCHHFREDQLIEMLNWMRLESGIGFFINDLHRHPLAYHSIKWLTTAFSRSRLVRNDAPLSVLRGFSRRDWEQILQQAAITKYDLQWKWAFRWLLTVDLSPSGS